MSDTLTGVKIIAIDTDNLGDAEDNPEAVQFFVRLSGEPPPGWAAEFDPLYAAVPLAPKPPVTVEGNTLSVVYLPRYVDKLPQFFEVLSRTVAQANAEQVKTHDMKTSDVREQRKAEFSKALKKVQLPKADG